MNKNSNKSRLRILEVFRDLVLARAYDEITVQDIIDQANLARSTFYAQFTGKRALLLASMDPIMELLIKCAEGTANEQEVSAFASHCWENRIYGRRILHGDAYRLVSRTLAKSIHQQCGLSPVESTAFAHASLGTIQSWLSGEISSTQVEIVTWLRSRCD